MSTDATISATTSDDLVELDAASQAKVDIATNWAAEFVAPQAESWETERRFASEAFQSAAANGLTGLLVPATDGGSALNPIALARVLEEIAAVDFAVAFSLVCHNNLANAVNRLAPPHQRAAFLPELVSGNKLGAFLLTEPDAGSDAAAITLSAQPDGDDWVLNGRKAWVTNGTNADLLSVYAQTNPDLGHKGIAAFLVDADLFEASRTGVSTAATESLVREDAYPLVGAHAMGTNGFQFNQCRVSGDALFVLPGEGFRAAMAGIDTARTLVSAMCCGMLRTALATASDYVRQRQAFGGRVADLQGVRFTLADVATDLEAARLLAYRAAKALTENNNKSASIAAAHAKKFATRITERRIADCMQVMGAAGARRDHPLPRHLAAARIANYLDGATEIQNVVISRALLD